MSILGKIFGQPPPPSSKSITFDDSRYAYQGERDGTRIWFLPDGGGVGLYFFPVPPGLPAGLSTVEQLQAFYSSQMGANQRIVECRMQSLDRAKGIWLITKGTEPNKGGAVYLSSLTIPFENFSFVIKIQCQEQGVTGVREALVLDSALRDGKATLKDGKIMMQGVSSDDECFDSLAPKHPLSRIRRELRAIADSLQIEEQVRTEKRFELPEA